MRWKKTKRSGYQKGQENRKCNMGDEKKLRKMGMESRAGENMGKFKSIASFNLFYEEFLFPRNEEVRLSTLKSG
ncbi:MAG TPA: hypothetical protein EYH24_03320 [Thermococcus paralvinellae]|uniref:Uncharacterized protein n=1 Tax=Thermococcus paralvinellae TaxID=582419 RepID=A0A832ZHE2_9EURY|nr:hypothetical protein [Thermococcus paralvinellae]